MVGAAALAVACLWDSDTLAMEAKGLPDVVDVIGGRFDRNPDLYYEMRLARVQRELESDRPLLEHYDDAAIACDELGRGEEAIAWMDKKAALLEEIELTTNSPHPYRYWANIGTVRVHDWMRRGAPDDDLAALEQAITEIETAIEINPDAHFGREFVQLYLMRLLLLDKQGDHGDPRVADAAYLLNREFMDIDNELVDWHDHFEGLIEGVVGMIVMGGGWESPDSYALLAKLLSHNQDGVLADLAQKRSAELVDSGRRYFFTKEMHKNLLRPLQTIEEERAAEMKTYFSAVRENGDEYTENRDAFMLAKLERGEHPDTHDDFWAGYQEVANVDFEEVSRTAASDSSPAWIVPFGLAIPAGFFGLWYWTRRNSRKAA